MEVWDISHLRGSRAVGHTSAACRCFLRENRPYQVSAGNRQQAALADFGIEPSRFSAPRLSARHCTKHTPYLALVSPKQRLYLVGCRFHFTEVSGSGSLAQGHAADLHGVGATLTTAP